MAKLSSKAFRLGVVSSLTFVLGATPAFAIDNQSFQSTQQPVDSLAPNPQALTTSADGLATNTVEELYDLVSLESGANHSFDVEKAITLAELELGTSRMTGWGMPGECIMSAKRWINADGRNTWESSGSPVTNYDAAVKVPFSLVQPGDIIQYENIFFPDAWVTGVHTVMVTKVNGDGTVDIIQSNAPAGSGLVSKETNWLPAPPDGFQASVWRF